ncbi:MAG: flippase-like domain-containing protein [Thermoflavifilum sp.]|nr:flippase-like domain-containing protein [Thermoflavifilum sp.]
MNKSTKIIFNTLISVVLSVGLFYLIYRQLQHQENLGLAWQQMRALASGRGFVGLLIVLLLVIPNWLLEARKWQLLVGLFEPISLWKALQSVLTGLSLGVNTPNRIGEYAGRILTIKDPYRLEAATVMWVGSLSQLIITLGFGWLGLVYTVVTGVIDPTINSWWWKSLGVLLIGMSVGLAILYFRKDLLVAFFLYFKRFRFLIRAGKAIKAIPKAILVRLLGLSALRYLIFTGQYLLLLQLLGTAVPWVGGFFALSLIYLIMAFLPTMAIAEIGIRGELNIYFLQTYTTNTLAVLTAAVIIWLINLIFPAIVGSILWLKVKAIHKKAVNVVKRT